MTDPRIEAAAEELRNIEFEQAGLSESPWRLSVAQEAYRKDARRILAAADKVATTEWGTGLGDEVMIWKDRAQAERQRASATATYDGGKTWVHTNPPLVSRTLTEWQEHHA